MVAQAAHWQMSTADAMPRSRPCSLIVSSHYMPGCETMMHRQRAPRLAAHREALERLAVGVVDRGQETRSVVGPFLGRRVLSRQTRLVDSETRVTAAVHQRHRRPASVERFASSPSLRTGFESALHALV